MPGTEGTDNSSKQSHVGRARGLSGVTSGHVAAVLGSHTFDRDSSETKEPVHSHAHQHQHQRQHPCTDEKHTHTTTVGCGSSPCGVGGSVGVASSPCSSSFSSSSLIPGVVFDGNVMSLVPAAAVPLLQRMFSDSCSLQSSALVLLAQGDLTIKLDLNPPASIPSYQALARSHANTWLLEIHPQYIRHYHNLREVCNTYLAFHDEMMTLATQLDDTTSRDTLLTAINILLNKIKTYGDDQNSDTATLQAAVAQLHQEMKQDHNNYTNINQQAVQQYTGPNGEIQQLRSDKDDAIKQIALESTAIGLGLAIDAAGAYLVYRSLWLEGVAGEEMVLLPCLFVVTGTAVATAAAVELAKTVKRYNSDVTQLAIDNVDVSALEAAYQQFNSFYLSHQQSRDTIHGTNAQHAQHAAPTPAPTPLSSMWSTFRSSFSSLASLVSAGSVNADNIRSILLTSQKDFLSLNDSLTNCLFNGTLPVQTNEVTHYVINTKHIHQYPTLLQRIIGKHNVTQQGQTAFHNDQDFLWTQQAALWLANTHQKLQQIKHSTENVGGSMFISSAAAPTLPPFKSTLTSTFSKSATIQTYCQTVFNQPSINIPLEGVDPNAEIATARTHCQSWMSDYHPELNSIMIDVDDFCNTFLSFYTPLHDFALELPKLPKSEQPDKLKDIIKGIDLLGERVNFKSRKLPDLITKFNTFFKDVSQDQVEFEKIVTKATNTYLGKNGVISQQHADILQLQADIAELSASIITDAAMAGAGGAGIALGIYLSSCTFPQVGVVVAIGGATLLSAGVGKIAQAIHDRQEKEDQMNRDSALIKQEEQQLDALSVLQNQFQSFSDKAKEVSTIVTDMSTNWDSLKDYFKALKSALDSADETGAVLLASALEGANLTFNDLKNQALYCISDGKDGKLPVLKNIQLTLLTRN